MAHPLRKQARHVQRELSRDKTLEVPTYQWCLQQVIKYWAHTQGRRAAERKAKLVELIRPLARPAKPNPHREKARAKREETETPRVPPDGA